MTIPSCSLWIFVARTDVSFILETIPHLVKMRNFSFEEKVLAVDTAPLMGDKVTRPGIGTMEQLRECTQQLLTAGVVDRVVDISYDPPYHDRIYRKHFGTPIRFTHNYKGYPILGSIFTIEECKSDYMLHFDSDMLLYQNRDYDWINAGMKLMEENSDMMFIRPLAGPPTEDGKMYQYNDYEKVSEQFYKFKFFGSRVYLVNCKRYDNLLPLPINWLPYRQTFLNILPISWQTPVNNLTGKGKLNSWEVMVSQKLEKTNYYRRNLSDPNAWTLHPKDRSPKFIKALPSIIQKIETGDYPLAQAGHYDLISELWF